MKPAAAVVLGTVLAGLTAMPAAAQAIRDYKFLVHHVDPSLNILETEETAIVPLVPQGVCFEWRLQIDEEEDEMLEVTELFKLPRPPAEWTNIEANPYSLTTISEDRRTAATKMLLVTQDGWFGHEWCVGDGDPPGDYEIEVLSGSLSLHQFYFTVLEQ